MCRASLRSLDASYCTQLSDRSCLAIAAEEGCCFIDRLALAGCSRVSDAGILAIAGQCPYLLYFNRCSVPYLTQMVFGNNLSHVAVEACLLARSGFGRAKTQSQRRFPQRWSCLIRLRCGGRDRFTWVSLSLLVC